MWCDNTVFRVGWGGPTRYIEVALAVRRVVLPVIVLNVCDLCDPGRASNHLARTSVLEVIMKGSEL